MELFFFNFRQFGEKLTFARYKRISSIQLNETEGTSAILCHKSFDFSESLIFAEYDNRTIFISYKI